MIALVLPDTDEGGALILAERLRRAAQLNLGDLPVQISMSFGVASHPWHGADARALRTAAEQAMSAARVRGGQRALIYGAEVARVRLENGCTPRRCVPRQRRLLKRARDPSHSSHRRLRPHPLKGGSAAVRARDRHTRHKCHKVVTKSSGHVAFQPRVRSTNSLIASPPPRASRNTP